MKYRTPTGAFLMLVLGLCRTAATAQTYHFDFEGPNALSGWVQSDGQPINLGAGASGANALAIPLDPLHTERRVYYQIPFNPALTYRYSSWMKTDVVGIQQRVFLAWVDFSNGTTYYTDTYYIPGGLNGWKALATPPHIIPANDFSANPNAHFCIVLEAGSGNVATAFFDDVHMAITSAPTAFLWTKVMLGGNYTNGFMSAGLRNQNLLPAQEPYTAMGHVQMGGGGGEVAPAAWWGVNNLDGPVDWVRVELRSSADPSVIVATRQGLVSQSGSITEIDGSSTISFSVVPGNYYVAVRHRNHLGCMTATPVALSGPIVVPWSASAGVDFTSAATATWGNDARKVGDLIYNYRVLWPGDTNGDGMIKYAGSNNDRDPILVTVGGTVPTNTLLNVYNRHDVNLDGAVKYTGANNDRDPILQSIGGQIPTLTRAAQLP